jgi:hypothetical protein
MQQDCFQEAVIAEALADAAAVLQTPQQCPPDKYG